MSAIQYKTLKTCKM